jgi:hypothetical protein
MKKYRIVKTQKIDVNAHKTKLLYTDEFIVERCVSGFWGLIKDWIKVSSHDSLLEAEVHIEAYIAQNDKRVEIVKEYTIL